MPFFSSLFENDQDHKKHGSLTNKTMSCRIQSENFPKSIKTHSSLTNKRPYPAQRTHEGQKNRIYILPEKKALPPCHVCIWIMLGRRRRRRRKTTFLLKFKSGLRRKKRRVKIKQKLQLFSYMCMFKKTDDLSC